MSTPEAFLAEILANPGDEAPRLVYADWLEDHGDPARAEFVRLQVRLAAMPEYDPERFELEERSRDLLAEHRAAWVAHLPKWARELPLTFRRGFVAAAQMKIPDFLRHGRRLCQLVPLQSLTLPGPAVDDAADAPGMGHIEELNLVGCHTSETFFARLRPGRLRSLSAIGDAVTRWAGLAQLRRLRVYLPGGLALLTGSPHLLALEELDTGTGRLVPDSVKALIACERLASLRRLNIELSTGNVAPAALAAGPWGRLEELGINFLDNHDEGTSRRLLAAPWIGGLRSLRLARLAGVAASLRARAEGRLACLDLRRCDPDAGELDALASAELGPGLRSLSLWHMRLPDGGRALARSPHLGRLDRLQIESEIDTDDMAALLDPDSLPSLRHLHLQSERQISLAPFARQGAARLRSLALPGCRLGARAGEELAAAAHLRLARLDLSDNQLGDAGVAALLRAPWLPWLRELDLCGNGAREGGAVALASCPGLSRLRVLNLCGSAVGAAGAAALAESPHLGRLLRLVLRPGRFGGAVRRLKERFGPALSLDYY